MPEMKITEDELSVLLMIKKKQLTHKKSKDFLKVFCFLLDKNFFTCRGGKKIAMFDMDGKLRRIVTEQIDWKE